MKKAFLLLFIAFVGFANAQDVQFDINIGDTLVWRPYSRCDNISYKVSDKHCIDFSLVKYGEKVQVIGKTNGVSEIRAICTDTAVVARIVVSDKSIMHNDNKIEKPATQAFTGTYQFNPPTNHFFITYSDPANNSTITKVKIGSEEATNDGHGTDRFWDTKTGKNYYYRPDSQGWTIDVDWDFEAFAEDLFFPLNNFAREVNADSIPTCFTGMETVCGINCWTFFVIFSDEQAIRYWVDPSNGCTLRRQVNNNEPVTVTLYNLNYTKWEFGPKYKHSLHDTTRGKE